MLRYSKDLLQDIIKKARVAERKRFIYSLHKSNTELQRLLNAVEPDTYVCPHKHTHTPEIFIRLRGRVALLTFDDSGEIKDKFILDEENPGAEIPVNTWHSLVSLDRDSVLYLVMEGPYDEKTHKTFPKWAPRESTEDAIKYLKMLRKRI